MMVFKGTKKSDNNKSYLNLRCLLLGGRLLSSHKALNTLEEVFFFLLFYSYYVYSCAALSLSYS